MTKPQFKKAPLVETVLRLRSRLDDRAVVFVGLMGVGKSTIGKRVATILGLPFFDADEEIEKASKMTITDLFSSYGEDEFRKLERRVILRLLSQRPIVLATGGGAYINDEVRDAIKKTAVSVWLNANLDVLMKRVMRRKHRPLLNSDNPIRVMQSLMEKRNPIYAKADVCITGGDARRDVIAHRVVRSVHQYLFSSSISGPNNDNENDQSRIRRP